MSAYEATPRADPTVACTHRYQITILLDTKVKIQKKKNISKVS